MDINVYILFKYFDPSAAVEFFNELDRVPPGLESMSLGVPAPRERLRDKPGAVLRNVGARFNNFDEFSFLVFIVALRSELVDYSEGASKEKGEAGDGVGWDKS